MTLQTGLEHLLQDRDRVGQLSRPRVALVAHPASVTADLTHSLDALIAAGVNISAAFGPQHGMRGDKQDNMIESPDYRDPLHDVPVFSLYGKGRRPSAEMMASFDIMLFDVQDLGCRIYTYNTTLLYLLEACAEAGKPLWVLDRPNPAGREMEGSLLQDGWQSFVGASTMLMRHGLTAGEMARWFVDRHQIDVDLQVVTMTGYHPDQGPGYGWTPHERPWINPSPNAASLNMARCYAGTVMLEGTTLSEGRGTTVALELVGAPDIDTVRILKRMRERAPQWCRGVLLRPCFFEPTFHKHEGQLCQGLHWHTDYAAYDPRAFRPYRLMLLFLKVMREYYPEYDLWRDFPYEYENDRLAIDLINGGPWIREWVDDPAADTAELEQRLSEDESAWREQTRDLLLY